MEFANTAICKVKPTPDHTLLGNKGHNKANLSHRSAFAVQSDCVRHPIGSRSPSNQIAFGARSDCVRHPIRLRSVNDGFCFVCQSIVRYAFIARDVLQEVVAALLVVYLATVMLQTIAHHEIIYV